MFRELLNINLDDDHSDSDSLVCSHTASTGPEATLAVCSGLQWEPQCNATAHITSICIASFMVKLAKISCQRGHCRERHDWDLIRELTTIMSDLDMLAASWTNSAEAELSFDEVTDFPPVGRAMLEGRHITNTIQGAGHQWNTNVRLSTQPGHCNPRCSNN